MIESWPCVFVFVPKRSKTGPTSHAFFSTSLHRLRLQEFPRGLGKGSDAGVVGGWLEAVLEEMNDDFANIPDSHKN